MLRFRAGAVPAVAAALRILAFLLALGPVPAAATTVVPVADEALVEQAALIVVARVVGSQVSAGSVRGGLIETDVQVKVEEVLKGRLGSAWDLTVRLPGGVRPDGVGLALFGVPELRPGERTLLFLNPGRTGTWTPLHLMLGAFREVHVRGERLALRSLSEVRIEPAPREAGTADGPRIGSEGLRDFERFRSWVAAYAAGRVGKGRTVEYTLADPGGELEHAGAAFTRLASPPGRWFRFDTGGQVAWSAESRGQPGVPGGGFAEFQAALAAWTDDPDTPVLLTYAGKGTRDAGSARPDSRSVILFNDPLNQIPGSYSCTGAEGGVLALGGYLFHAGNRAVFKGETYLKIAEGVIITQNGSGCYFAESLDPSGAAEELFGHEVGHTLGLGHSSENPNESNLALHQALMFFAPPERPDGAHLTADDRAALRLLYQAPSSGTPAAATGLTATALSSTTVRLAWTPGADPSQPADVWEHRLERRVGQGAFADAGFFPADATGALVEGLAPATAYGFRIVAVGRDGGRSGPSNEARATTPARTPPCTPGPDRLCLGGGRFGVEVRWATPEGATGAGHAVPLGGETGLFWFFDPGNIELAVKVLDACALSSRTWFFAGGLTDLGLRITVTDTATGRVRQYDNPAGTPFRPLQDTDAFANCPGTGAAGSPVRVSAATGAAPAETAAAGAAPARPTGLRAEALSSSAVRLDWADNSLEAEFRIDQRLGAAPWTEIARTPFAGALVNGLAPGTLYRFRVRAVGRDGTLSGASNQADVETWAETPPCASGPERLCLAGGRFAAEIAWRRATGESGPGKTLPFADDTGLFWFFDPGNLEVVLKVLDGCAVNGRHWVFAGGLTDVASLVSVTDTHTGAVQLYGTRQGVPFQPLQDTGAFACP